MKRPLWFLLIAWTLGGLVLLFLDRGSCGWWDWVWVVLFALAAYGGLAARAGLAAARMCAIAVVASFAAAIAIPDLAGAAPFHFTPQAGPKLGGLVPLLLPVLLFAMLSVSERAAGVVFPYAGRAGHAGWTATAFLLSIANGVVFISGPRAWGGWTFSGSEWLVPVLSAIVLTALAFGLTFAYPVDSRMRWTRWSVEVAAWLAMNILFLAARVALPLEGK